MEPFCTTINYRDMLSLLTSDRRGDRLLVVMWWVYVVSPVLPCCMTYVGVGSVGHADCLLVPTQTIMDNVLTQTCAHRKPAKHLYKAFRNTEIVPGGLLTVPKTPPQGLILTSRKALWRPCRQWVSKCLVWTHIAHSIRETTPVGPLLAMINVSVLYKDIALPS